MSNWRLIPDYDEIAWAAALDRCGDHDVYHLARYHRVGTPLGAGDGWLFYLDHDGAAAAVPFLVRPIGETDLVDAVSAYGYPGIIASVEEPDAALADAFADGLGEAFDELGVVSWFGRQHPLFHTDWLVSERTDVVDLGPVVMIDLSGSEEEIAAQSNSNHRRNLRKTAALDLEVREDAAFERIDEFIEAYDATMIRNGASPSYLFPKSYYSALKEQLGPAVTMFHVYIDGAHATSVMVFRHNGIVEYHLGGTKEAFTASGTARYALEHARRWAKQNGDRWFHLGGGVGAAEDSLFRFKSGFAKTYKRYRVVRWIQDRECYDELVSQRRAEPPAPPDGFFPAYRG